MTWKWYRPKKNGNLLSVHSLIQDHIKNMKIRNKESDFLSF